MVDPEIAGSGRPVVHVKQARSIGTECGAAPGWLIHTFGSGQRGGFAGGKIVNEDVFDCHPHWRANDETFAIGRKFFASNLPLIFRDPRDLLGRDVEQADVLVPVGGIRSHQNALAVRRDIDSPNSALSFVRREQCALRSRDISEENI